MNHYEDPDLLARKRGLSPCAEKVLCKITLEIFAMIAFDVIHERYLPGFQDIKMF